MRSAPDSVMGKCSVKRSVETKIIYGENIHLTRTNKCQYLPTENFEEIGVTEKKEDLSKSILNTKVEHKHGY